MTAALATCSHRKPPFKMGPTVLYTPPAVSMAQNMGLGHVSPESCAWLPLSKPNSLGAAELAVREAFLGLCQAVLLLLILPEVDHLCRLVQQQHLVPARSRARSPPVKPPRRTQVGSRYTSESDDVHTRHSGSGFTRNCLETPNSIHVPRIRTAQTPRACSPARSSAPPMHPSSARRRTL